MSALLLLLVAVLPARAGEEFLDNLFAHGATASTLGGSSEGGSWAMRLSVGHPWSSLRLQRGIGNWTPLVELQTGMLDTEFPAFALPSRWMTSVGLARPWIDHRWRLTGEALLGSLADMQARGPSAELRLRLIRAHGRFQPYSALGTRHSLLRPRKDKGAERAHEWMLTGELGLGIGIGQWSGLDLGLDFPVIDAPFPPDDPDTLRQRSAIGAHLGLQLGGE